MRPSLTKFALLSVGVAMLTILIKMAAYLLTDSVGFLSDALEGIVNLVAASVALITLKVVERPPDEMHEYGHDKAEYFSSGIEGTLIAIAAISILYTSFRRLLEPQPLQQAGLGLALVIAAALLNLVVGQLLIRNGKKFDSITLEADGKHLMSDVWTSLGVVIGVSLAVLTGLTWLDPVVGILVGLKIGYEGGRIFNRSALGLMDTAIEPKERDFVEKVLNEQVSGEVNWHALRTRQSGSRRFMSVHLLVPGYWTVQRAHDLAESVEQQIRQHINYSSMFTHLEPVEDPRSHQDLALDRDEAHPDA